jgi:enterochelin esterase-like enzyme
MRTMCLRQAIGLLIILTLICGTAACLPPPELVSTPLTSTLSSPSTLPPTLAATGTPIPPTPTPGCTEVGTLEPAELTSDSMPANLRFLVYLPPCYTVQMGLRYPVLYLFHGAFFDENQWMRLGISAAADRLIASGDISPLIIVMPLDPYTYQPGEYGFDEAFLQDLVPYIDSHYRTLPDRTHRAVGGLSRGSSWALHFGLSHPELFGAIGMHSPVVFASEGWLDIIPSESMPQVYLDVSENDPNLQNTRWLEDILTTRGVPHEWHLNTGYHEETYWASHVEEYLRWYGANWESNP